MHSFSGNAVADFEEFVEKHQRKKERKQRKLKQSGLNLETIEALTPTQQSVFDSYDDTKSSITWLRWHRQNIFIQLSSSKRYYRSCR